MSSTADKIEVMQAFLEGFTIECRHTHKRNQYYPEWCACDCPQWWWHDWEYRVKPPMARKFEVTVTGDVKCMPQRDIFHIMVNESRHPRFQWTVKEVADAKT